MYQKCPLCEGSGKAKNQVSLCEVCKGERIIDTVTGLPPSKSDATKVDADKITDFREFNMESQKEYYGK